MKVEWGHWYLSSVSIDKQYELTGVLSGVTDLKDDLKICPITISRQKKLGLLLVMMALR